jgi:hypothetical protein
MYYLCKNLDILKALLSIIYFHNKIENIFNVINLLLLLLLLLLL